MKKILFVAIAMVAMSFASCGNGATCGSASNDSDSVADTVDTVLVDSVDSVCMD